MNFWEQLTETSIAGIEAWRILALFMTILIAFVAGRMTRFFLRRAADHLDERYPPVLAVALRAIERSIGPALFVLGLRVGRWRSGPGSGCSGHHQKLLWLSHALRGQTL